MALSRSMKNLMHDSAMARRGGGNPTGGGRSGMVGRAFQQARDKAGGAPSPTRGGMLSRVGKAAGQARGRYNPGPKLQRGPSGPTRGPRGPVMTPGGGKPRRGLAQIAVPGGRMPRGGVMGGPAGRRGPGTAGAVAGKPRPPAGTFGFASRGGGTPALQEATAGARRQVMGQRAAAPAALAPPRGQAVAQRVAGRQGPPARRGGMARALGSGGSRRRMLR
jgi:hypothetical protein